MSDTIHCQQCAAPLPVQQGRQFVTCDFCQAENFVDKRTAVLHYAVRDTLGAESASAALRRWMGGNQTIKDLDKKATITDVTFQLFPMWLVRAELDSDERVVLEPAAALVVTELTQLTVPAAALEPYDHTLDDQAIPPSVPLETMKKWLAENERIAAHHIREVSLVHLPIFVCRYRFDSRTYTAVVDAASSQVFANTFPSKWEAPYLAIGFAALLAYFCAALVPYGSYALNNATGLLVGIILYIVVSIIIAVPIFAVAAYISAKV